jgi:YD repeat-containing protein
MPARHRPRGNGGRAFFGRLCLIAALAAGAGCLPPPPPATLPPVTRIVATADVTLIPPSPAPTGTPTDSGWSAIAPGLERRELGIPLAPWPAQRLIIFRADPAAFTLRVLYTPGFPSFVSAWDRDARLVFNGGFFDENDAALGLLVSDGRAYGQTYAGFGGMLSVNTLGALSLRSLAAEPVGPNEAFAQAVQCFPLLVRPDGGRYTDEDDQHARRTAVGWDAAGRLLVLVAPDGGFTLAGLAAWLQASDLGLTLALNLDGGGSTGYYAGAGDQIDSLTPVPAVIALYDL